MLIAIAHIGGTMLVLFILGVLNLWLISWESERNAKRRLQSAALALGGGVEQLEREEMIPRLVQYSADRFSSELFRNRLADFCGPLRTVWVWLGSLCQLLALGAVVWSAFISGPDVAVVAWSAVGIAIFFWVTTILSSYACLLLTGRFPGEAKAARTALSSFLEERARVAHEA
jgi:hypothetical protein